MARSSLYDNVHAVNSEYVPKFVGSAYNELSSAAKALDTRYRDNKEYSDKIAIMQANEQYLEADNHIKESMRDQIYGSISKIAGSDDNFENSTAAVSQLARDYFTNQNRIAALDNFKRVEEAKQLRNKLGANAINFGDDPDSFSTLDPATGQARRFNNAIEERADYSKKMQDLLGRVAADGFVTSPTGQKIMIDDTERNLIRSGQTHLISKTKLNRLVDGLLYTYKSSNEGKQDVRRLTQLGNVPTETIQVPIHDDRGKVIGQRQTNQVDEDIRSRFRSVAYPQAFTQNMQKWDDFGLTKAELAKQAVQSNNYSPTSPGSVTDNTTFTPVSDPEDDEFVQKLDDDTYVEYYDKATGQKVKKDDIEPSYSGPQLKGNKDSASREEQVSKYNQGSNPYTIKLVNGQEANGQLQALYNQAVNNGLKYKDFNEFKESYRGAVKNHQKITPTGNIIQPDQAGIYKDLANRLSANSPLFFKEGDKPVSSLENFAKELDVSPSDIELEPISTYFDSPRKDLPGGYIEAKVKVKGDKGVKNHPTTVFMPMGDQFAGLAETVDDLYKNSFYQGSDTYTIEKPKLATVGGQPMMNKQGEQLAFYTTTLPLPKSQQQAGKPGFKTVVHSMKVVPNNSGGYDIIPSGEDMSIGQWKQNMIKAISPLFKDALNSGQTFNRKDFKDQGVEY